MGPLSLGEPFRLQEIPQLQRRLQRKSSRFSDGIIYVVVTYILKRNTLKGAKTLSVS